MLHPSQSYFLPLRCIWNKGKMPCVELLEETEPAGWFGKSTGFGYGSSRFPCCTSFIFVTLICVMKLKNTNIKKLNRAIF